jgi:hypothetical protein
VSTTKYAARLSGPERAAFGAKVAKRYAKGENIRSIANDTGRSYGTIHALLVEQDVEFRSRGGDRRSAKRKR